MLNEELQNHHAEIDNQERILEIEKANFDTMCERYNFMQIKHGVNTANISRPETETREDRIIAVLDLLDNYNWALIDLDKHTLMEALENINGHVESFLLSFYELFFIQKIQNKI